MENYTKPAMEIVEIELENSLCESTTVFGIPVDDDYVPGQTGDHNGSRTW